MAEDYNDHNAYNAAERDPAVGNPATADQGAAIPVGLAEPIDATELTDPAEPVDADPAEPV
ncbi:MAG TPA: hypothetical protein VF979_12155, partial [Streptosporangiaceae bacterium]